MDLSFIKTVYFGLYKRDKSIVIKFNFINDFDITTFKYNQKKVTVYVLVENTKLNEIFKVKCNVKKSAYSAENYYI